MSVRTGFAEALPAETASLDAAVASVVLCTVADPALALAELKRVLRPGGELRFFEHVRSERPSKASIQRALDRSGLWPLLAGGCHCGWETVASIEAARSATGNRRIRPVVSSGAARRGVVALLERIALAAAGMIVSINVCTGVPLLALWLGSRAANGNVLSWIGIVTAIVSLAVLAAFSVAALTRLSARYDRVTGRPPPTRQPRPWELSMRAERAAPDRARRAANPIETIVVLTVVVAFIALEVWYVFFAGSPFTSI